MGCLLLGTDHELMLSVSPCYISAWSSNFLLHWLNLLNIECFYWGVSDTRDKLYLKDVGAKMVLCLAGELFTTRLCGCKRDSGCLNGSSSIRDKPDSHPLEEVNPGRLLETGNAHERSLCAHGGGVGFWFSPFGCMGSDINWLVGSGVDISVYTASCSVDAGGQRVVQEGFWLWFLGECQVIAVIWEDFCTRELTRTKVSNLLSNYRAFYKPYRFPCLWQEFEFQTERAVWG